MDSIHLHGAEDVRSAGHAMARAAETTSSAASTISAAADVNSGAVQQLQYVLENFTRDMSEIVSRFEGAVRHQSDALIRSPTDNETIRIRRAQLGNPYWLPGDPG
jgi:hypothetical protein